MTRKESTKGSCLCWLTTLNLKNYHTLSTRIGKKSKNIRNYHTIYPGPTVMTFCRLRGIKDVLVRADLSSKPGSSSVFFFKRLREQTMSELQANTETFKLTVIDWYETHNISQLAKLQTLCISYCDKVVTSMLVRQNSHFTNVWTIFGVYIINDCCLLSTVSFFITNQHPRKKVVD